MPVRKKLIEVALPLEPSTEPVPGRNPSATATRAPCTCGGHGRTAGSLPGGDLRFVGG